MDTFKGPNLKIIRQFSVSPQVVFDAFTDPESMRIWWTDDTEFDMDLRVGGRWTIRRMEGDTELVMTGEYLEIDKPKHLQHTIAMPQFSPNYDMLTIDISPDGEGGSELTFVQSGKDISAELESLTEGGVSETEKGWQQGFDLMEEAWEKNS